MNIKKKVYCVGLVICDVPLRPVTKESLETDHTSIEDPVWAPGGDAANAAVALTRLGFDASLSGLVGNDHYGDFVIESLKASGVNVEGVQRHPVYGTQVSHILIEPSGERHFLISSPINGELKYEHLNERFIAESDLVYIGSTLCLKGLDYGGSAELFKKAHSLGKITATDFGGDDSDRGDYWLKTLEPLLRETDIALPSYREAAAITGKKELPEIRDALAPFGIKILAVKLGSSGCYITDFKNEWRLPAFEEFKPVDTTGAGDSFSAGFVRGFLSGWDIRTCGLFASAVAGFNVTKVGAVAGVPDFQTAYNFVFG
ncbi:MAG: carbohydrate kinase family protein [Treponema sp.]|jgi:sugar/nucleoside kinase (ribokinase family)|nr:carbohydrate kinase family protein [Treponema sp.]